MSSSTPGNPGNQQNGSSAKPIDAIRQDAKNDTVNDSKAGSSAKTGTESGAASYSSGGKLGASENPGNVERADRTDASDTNSGTTQAGGRR